MVGHDPGPPAALSPACPEEGSVTAGPLVVLAQREGLVAVDKPPGLPSTGRTRDDPRCVQALLDAQLGVTTWAVHQLDRGTTGVLLFVTRRSLVEPWAARLARGSKAYLALCHGVPGWTTRVVDAPLERAGDRERVSETGKPAQTHLSLLGHAGEGPGAVSAVVARPRTGRTHQVRVHLAEVGLPLLGEDRYRSPPSTAADRPLLHCWEIFLPGDDGGLTLTASVPSDALEVAARLGLDLPDRPPPLRRRRP